MKTPKLLFALPAVALLVASVPTNADARTKDIVKYGAIGLGVAALANMSQQNSYYGGGYYSQPYYGGYYSQPYYGGYGYSYPSYSYGYSSYNYYPSNYYGGYYGYGY
jgi:hypothetical protein